MTDSAFLLAVLNDGKWHSNTEILQASIAERGVGMTLHSRAADLRKRGYTIEVQVKGGSRRTSFYRMVGALNEPEAGRVAARHGVSGSLSASSIPAGRREQTPQGRGGDALFTLPKGAYDD